MLKNFCIVAPTDQGGGTLDGASVSERQSLFCNDVGELFAAATHWRVQVFEGQLVDAPPSDLYGLSRSIKDVQIAALAADARPGVMQRVVLINEHRLSALPALEQDQAACNIQYYFPGCWKKPKKNRLWGRIDVMTRFGARPIVDWETMRSEHYVWLTHDDHPTLLTLFCAYADAYLDYLAELESAGV